jgi:hypothetical protein
LNPEPLNVYNVIQEDFKVLKFAITFIFALPFFFCSVSLACDWAYGVRSGDDASELCVTIEKNADGITYRSTYRDVKQLYHYDTENSLLRWEYADSGSQTSFNAIRSGGEIIVSGTSSGQPVNKSLAAGDEVWLQNSEFGLLEFLKTKEKTKEFIVIAPEDISIKKFRATREAEEEISWNGQKIRVVKLKARLRGFLSLFWQATYWHRLPEITFLRYKAEGLPGVPKADIQLVREKSVR